MSEKETLEKRAVEITSLPKEVLEEYGILYNLSGAGKDTGNITHSEGDGWSGREIVGALLDTPGTLGYTQGGNLPFLFTEMERHLHTQEAQIPLKDPICFCMAKAGDEPPCAQEAIPVILRPGYVFVFHRGTWHSASHGLEKPAGYYWMAWVYYNEPTVWRPIGGGPLRVLKGEE